jgi:hypothetical protein
LPGPGLLLRVFPSIEKIGGDHGTRNFALAAGRADTGDHFVVAVLRPLIAGYPHPNARSGSADGGVYFFAEHRHWNLQDDARIFAKIPV